MRPASLFIVFIVICHLELGLPSSCRAETSTPNFIIIFIDDMGYGDLGCYGNTTTRTPNIDRMAAEGLRFTSFYTSCPVCTPSRAGLLTGRYPIRSGLTRVLFPSSKDGIEDKEWTLAEGLKERGYSTACIGKWHLGHLPEFLPTRHGFDSYFGIPYSNDMDLVQRAEPPLPLMRNEAIIEQPANQDTLTRRYTEEAVGFIEAQKDQPFFLYLAHTMVHVPLHVSPEFKGHSASGLYGDVVEEIDWSVGQILAALERLHLDEKTLVVFTSDNGPWLIMKDHGGSAGPLRNGKGTTFEGGVREPGIFRWKGTIAPNRVTDEPAVNLDLFPTFLLLSGGTLPENPVLDGEDIRGILLGNGHRASQNFFFFHRENLQAYRSGDWKLKRASVEKTVNEPDLLPTMLFHISDDISEKNNLADKFPDRVKQMEQEMQAFKASLGDLPPGKR
ncbi:sulfatase [bacterium]|nr:sulfatase [bacterium]NUP93926.1 sulfatase [Candidatus Omnitrophota bacterium]